MLKRPDIACLAGACVVFLLLVTVAVSGASNILTGRVTITTTPAAVGQVKGRDSLLIRVPTAAAGGIDCGPADLPVATYVSTIRGSEVTFGSSAGGASEVINYYLTTGQTTPVVVHFKEEGGNLPAATPTVTPTP